MSKTESPLESHARESSPHTLPTMVTTAINGTVATALRKDTTTWYPPHVDFRKTFYILPNLFTLSSILCGFASLALSASGRSGEDLYLAALAVCFGLFFDTFDGRVARLTKTQTDLGRDLDSLADVVTFGAAPALLVYKWGLTDFGYTGIFIAGLFLCAGALRLARFNVLSRREETAGHKLPGKFTLGLPIPPAASLLVFLVIVGHNASEYRFIGEGSTAVIVLVLSFLMVSRVRFRSFKELRLTPKTVAVLLLVVGASAAWVLAGFAKAFIFFFLVLAYIVLGLAEELFFYRRRRIQERTATQAVQAEAAAADEEVLRELGAFDEDEQAAKGEGCAEDPAKRDAGHDHPAQATGRTQ
jgi:CDP-diacylglycerol--serine O-phosphatidyltransferase